MVDHETVFTDMYERNRWRADELLASDNASTSGPGSDIEQTKEIIQELPKLFKKHNITSVLDIPCGDFYWMRNVDLEGINYIGADVVKQTVEENIKKYEDRDNVLFCQLDLTKDLLPKVDLVFCRDCLVHFSFEDIHKALANIVKSESTYLLATTFINRTENADITTGEWRPLNLLQSPFSLPDPLMILDENCMENEGSFNDKSLCLWQRGSLCSLS